MNKEFIKETKLNQIVNLEIDYYFRTIIIGSSKKEICTKLKNILGKYDYMKYDENGRIKKVIWILPFTDINCQKILNKGFLCENINKDFNKGK